MGGSLFDRIANPIGWSQADRSLLAIAIVLPAILTFVVTASFLDGWPYLREGTDPLARALVARASLLLLVPWAVLLFVALVARRRCPQGRLLVWGTLLLYALSTAVFTCLTGAFSSPGWLAFLGGGTMGFLLFDRLTTAIGIVVFYVLVIAGALVVQLELLPQAAELHALSGVDAHASSWSRAAMCSIVLSAFTLLLIGHVVTRWRDREARYHRLAETDPLTGLPNRRRLLEILDQEVERVRRNGLPLSCVMVDLDHFKRVNDTHGHATGDQVLSVAARILAGELREVDVVARYGGEEFVILLPGTSSQGAEQVAARCLQRVERAAILAGQTRLSITASMGVATIVAGNAPRSAGDDLLARADQALYQAKEAGRNRAVVAA